MADGAPTTVRVEYVDAQAIGDAPWTDAGTYTDDVRDVLGSLDRDPQRVYRVQGQLYATSPSGSLVRLPRPVWTYSGEARAWIGERAWDTAWTECSDARWMLNAVAGIVERPTLVLAACACARTALHLVPDGELRPLRAIETAERWCRGEVTIDEVRDAAAAAWAETQQKIYVPATNDTASATTADSGGTDVLHNLKASSYARSAGFFHQRAFEFADAAEIGRFFPISPGGDNWRLKTLSGVTAGWGNGQQYTATQIQNLKDRRANFYYILAGVSLIGCDGKVAANEYIDVVRGRDWLSARLAEDVFALFTSLIKVPFTDAGIALVETAVRGVLQEGVAVGLLSPDPAPAVTVPKAADVSAEDKAARLLPDVKFTATLAGAINKAQIDGTISV